MPLDDLQKGPQILFAIFKQSENIPKAVTAAPAPAPIYKTLIQSFSTYLVQLKDSETFSW